MVIAVSACLLGENCKEDLRQGSVCADESVVTDGAVTRIKRYLPT